jgi:hypothetical protein
MRDDLSLLDQVLALSEGDVTTEAVRRVLGVVEEERFLELFDLLSRKDRSGLFGLVEALLDEGYDLVEFYHGLVESLRTLLRLRVGGDGADLPEERREEWTRRAEAFEAADLLRMLGMSAELETGGSLRRSTQPRVLLELLLLRFSYLDRTLEMEDLLRAVGGAPSPPAAEGAGPDGGPGGAADARDAPAGPRPRAGGSRGRTSDLLAAWSALIEDGAGIPPGLGTLLRTGRAHAPDAATLELVLPPGPCLERLQEEREVEQLRRALSEHYEGEARIRVREERDPAGNGGARVSVGEARSGKLEDLLEKEPGLRPAVEELDLELLD